MEVSPVLNSIRSSYEKRLLDLQTLGLNGRISSLQTCTKSQSFTTSKSENELESNVTEPKVTDQNVKETKSVLLLDRTLNLNFQLDLPTINPRFISIHKNEDRDQILDTDKARLLSISNEWLFASQTDEQDLFDLLERVSLHDPEFILKSCLYIRKVLNVKSLAHKLLAFSFENPNCRDFVDKYADAIIVLPTDLLKTIALLWSRTRMNYLPKKIRPALERQILNFSEFHLRKYKRRELVREGNYSSFESYVTLKRIVKLLHMKENRDRIMKLLECKYPLTAEQFYECRLEGDFDSTKAGTRMNFEAILTWESYINTNGNTAKSWEHLIESNAIPYMALVKNLRNIIMCKINAKHMDLVIEKLQDANEIEKCRIFPIEYLSAFDSLRKVFIEEGVTNARNRANVRRKKRFELHDQRRRRRLAKQLGLWDYVDKALIAMDKAFEIANSLNVAPIQGRTLIFIETGDYGLFSTKNNYLSALMILSRCEYGELYAILTSNSEPLLIQIENTERCTLRNVSNIVKAAQQLKDKQAELDKTTNLKTSDSPPDVAMDGITRISDFFHDLLFESPKVHFIDNTISITWTASFACDLEKYLNGYKRFRNDKMKRIFATPFWHRFDKSNNDIAVSVCTKEVLNFLTSSGIKEQLAEVERIDRTFKLLSKAEMRQMETLSTGNVVNTQHSITSSWKDVRIFISSSCEDMDEEMDVLRQCVLPELRKHAKLLNINLYQVGFNWKSKSIAETDLIWQFMETARKSDIYIGIIGHCSRQLTSPSIQMLIDQNFTMNHMAADMVNAEKPATIAELEVQQVVFERLERMKKRSFFYFSGNLKSSGNSKRLNSLKAKIKAANLNVFQLNESVNGSGGLGLQIVGVDKFAQHVFDSVWNSLLSLSNLYIDDQTEVQDEKAHGDHLAQLAIDDISASFESYLLDVHNCFSSTKMKEKTKELAASLDGDSVKAVISGVSGSGKSFLFASTINLWQWSVRNSKKAKAILYFKDILASYQLSVNCNLSYANFGLNYLFVTLSKLADNDYKINWSDLFQSNFSETLRKFKKLKSKLIAATAHTLLLICLDYIDSDSANVLQVLEDNLPDRLNYLVVMKSHCEESETGEGEEMEDKENTLGSDHIFQRYDSVIRVQIDDADSYVRRQWVTSILNRKKQKPLNAYQMRSLISKRAASLPLYVTISCHNLLLNISETSSEKVITKSISSLPQQLNLLVDCLIEALKKKYVFNVNIELLLALLCQNKVLGEKSLADMLVLDRLITEDMAQQSMSELAKLFPNGLIEPSEQFWSFIFSSINDLSCILGPRHNSSSLWISFNMISVHLAKRDDFNPIFKRAMFIQALYIWISANEMDTWKCTNMVYMHNLPHLLLKCERFTDLTSLLTSQQYLTYRCKFGYIEDLSCGMKAAISKCQAVSTTYDAIRRIIDALKVYPDKFTELFKNDRFMFNKRPLISTDLIYHHNTPINVLKVHQQNYTVTIGCADGTIKVFSLISNQCIYQLIGHSTSVNCLCYFGQEMLASSSDDGFVSIWNTKRQTRIRLYNSQHRLRTTGLTCTANNELLASASIDGSISTYNCRSLVVVNNWTVHNQSPISCIQDYSHRRLLAVLCWDKSIYMYEPYNGECRQVIQLDWVTTMEFLYGDSLKILFLSGNETLSIGTSQMDQYSLCSNKLIKVSCFNQSKHHLAIGYNDGSVSVHDRNIPNIEEIKLHNGYVEHVGVSRKGLVLAYSSGAVVSKRQYDSSDLFNDASTVFHKKSTNVIDMDVDLSIIAILYKPGSLIMFVDMDTNSTLSQMQIDDGLLTKIFYRQQIKTVFLQTKNALKFLSTKLRRPETINLKNHPKTLYDDPDQEIINSQVFEFHDNPSESVYVAIVTQRNKLLIYNVNIKCNFQTITKCSSFTDDIAGVSLFPDSSDNCSLIVALIFTHSVNPRIEWYKTTEKIGLQLRKQTSLSLNPPTVLIGNVIIHADGACSKYSINNEFTMEWECHVQTGEKYAYLACPKQPTTKEPLLGDEALYVIRNGRCYCYQMPPLKTVFEKWNLHKEKLNSLEILEDKTSVVSVSQDGRLLKTDLRKGFNQLKNCTAELPLSITVALKANKLTCCILYPCQKVQVWAKINNRIDNLSWKLQSTINLPMTDTKFAFFSPYEVIRLITMNGNHYISYYTYKKSRWRSCGRYGRHIGLPYYTNTLNSVVPVHTSNNGCADEEIRPVNLNASKLSWTDKCIIRSEDDILFSSEDYLSKIMFTDDALYMVGLLADLKSVVIYKRRSSDPTDQSSSYTMKEQEDNKDGASTKSSNPCATQSSSNTVKKQEDDEDGASTKSSNQWAVDDMPEKSTYEFFFDLYFDKCNDCEKIDLLNEHCICMAWINEQICIFAGDKNGRLFKIVVNINNYHDIGYSVLRHFHNESVTCIGYTSNSKILWSGSKDFTVLSQRVTTKDTVEHVNLLASIPRSITACPGEIDEVIVCCENGDIFPLQ